MDTTEEKPVQGPAAADAAAAEKQSRDDSRVNDESKANLGEKERLEKEDSNTDAGEEKGGDIDKEEVMAGKKRHLFKDATLFPMFFTMFSFRLVAGIHNLNFKIMTIQVL